MTAERTSYVYATAGGCEIRADVYRAERPNGAAVVWLHGGMLMIGSRADIAPGQLARLLAAGYSVVAGDYRLAPETKLPGILDDLEALFAWVRWHSAAWGVDADRLACMGQSAGGYLTLLAGHRLAQPPRALVAYYGYSDVDGAWYSRPDPFYCQQPSVRPEEAARAVGTTVISEPPGGHNRAQFYLYCRQRGLWPQAVVGPAPRLSPRAFDAYNPVRNVSTSYPPTFLVHGALDTDVPHAQSAQMADALERHGVPQVFVSLPAHGHGFNRQDEHLRDPVLAGVFEQALAFLNTHTAPR